MTVTTSYGAMKTEAFTGDRTAVSRERFSRSKISGRTGDLADQQQAPETKV